MDDSNTMNPQEENYSNDFFTNPELITGTTNLTNEQKILYRRRFLNKLYYIRREKHVLAFFYYMYKFFSVTLGVAIPALLSIQYYYNSGEGVQNPIYWSAWGLSLLGGFINGYTHIFKVEERYFLMRIFYQKMKYECWAFLLLFKKYEIKIEDEKLKHSELFSMFMESIESIINEYKNKDMEALLEDSKKKENETMEMQERTISFRQTMRQDIHHENTARQSKPPEPPNLLGVNSNNLPINLLTGQVYTHV
jgi:hypothetical protein